MFCKRNLLFLLATVVLFAGCSDQNDPTYPETTGQRLSALVRGEISSDMIDFEFVAKVGDGEGDPEPGTLLVRGRNLAYDTELGVLTVDLSVFNDSETSYPEPVGMTFMQFIPAEVTILDSDNDLNGAGALIMFEFDDDDGEWGPGEESQLRNVQFVVAAGTSVGFVARIDVGMMPDGGTIGGMVWHDENEDGVIDPDEGGVGGITMTLHAGEDSTVTPLSTVETAEDGTYHFDGLDAGYYTVVRGDREGMGGTTPSVMAVILVEVDGMVYDFLAANFGVTRDGGSSGNGTITGIVFNDLNGDGIKNEGESGLEGMTVTLSGDASDTRITRPSGSYDFTELAQGSYELTATGPEGWVRTTAEVIHVILESDEGVFNEGLFGWMEEDGGDFVEVGDYVHAKGEYYAEPHRLVAEIFNVSHCDDDGDKDGGDDDGCRENDCWGRLAGPVTDLSFEERYLEIMGTKVYFSDKDDWDFDDFDIGIRARVDAARDEEVNDGRVEACHRPHWWNGNRDRVKGFVQEVVRGDDDEITGVIVLNTLIEVTEDCDSDD